MIPQSLHQSGQLWLPYLFVALEHFAQLPSLVHSKNTIKILGAAWQDAGTSERIHKESQRVATLVRTAFDSVHRSTDLTTYAEVLAVDICLWRLCAWQPMLQLSVKAGIEGNVLPHNLQSHIIEHLGRGAGLNISGGARYWDQEGAISLHDS